jgi:hypothetical protein
MGPVEKGKKKERKKKERKQASKKERTILEARVSESVFLNKMDLRKEIHFKLQNYL